MKYVIICGSMQDDSQSLKVSGYIKSCLAAREKSSTVELIDLQAESLMHWDNSLWKGDAKWEKTWGPKQKMIKESDGIVLVTPEYAGMASPALKNLLLFTSSREMGHKPGLIVSVSASRGGSYPVAELRMSGYKNSKICYVPDHLIIRDVGSVLNTDPEKNNPKADHYIRERIAYTLDVLEAYTECLKGLRVKAGKSLFQDAYDFGM